MFADDTTLITTIDMHDTDFEKILNIRKDIKGKFYVFYQPKNEIFISIIEIKDTKINRAKMVFFGGFTMNDNVTWNDHRENVACTKVIGIVHRRKSYVRKTILIQLHKT